jgi:hypothetical protein
MFPISEDKLSIREITDYWSREIQPPASPNELLACFERAWWLGEIKVEIKASQITRLELLKRLFKSMRSCETPCIVFITAEDTPPAKIYELGDGYLHFDGRPRVPVPSGNADSWSEGSCADAFEVLAQKPSSEHYKEWTFVFLMMEITRDEFIRFLAVHGYDFPNFWRRPTDSRKPLKPAPVEMVRKAIRDVYDRKSALDDKPPNIKELVIPVRKQLEAKGYTATGNEIQEIGGNQEFDGLRLKPGQIWDRKRRRE